MAKKKSTFTNISENIGVKQRVYMGAIVLASAASIGGAVMAFSGGGNDDSDMRSKESVERSRLGIGANDASVKKAQVGEKNNFDENSPMAQKVKEAREAEIEKAKNQKGAGFMDPVVISDDPEPKSEEKIDPLDALINDTNVNTLKELEKERSKKDIVTGVDDTVRSNNAQESRNRRIAEMTQDIEQAKKLPGTQYVYVNRYGDDLTNDFMKDEMSRINKVRSAVAGRAKGLEVSTGTYNQGNVSSTVKAQSNSERDNGPSLSSNDPYFEGYLRDRTADAQPDIETSMRISRLVDQQIGSMYDSGSGQGQIGGFDRNSEGYSGQGVTGGPGVSRAISSRRSSDKPLKTVGDTCYGQLNMPVNSDAPTMVKATILDYNCGKLRGAQLMAEPARTGEYIQLTFNTMKYDGRAHSVNAIALDPESQSGVMADDVNRHIVSRYLSLAVAAGLPGWADSVQEVERTEDADGDERTVTKTVSGTDQIAVITGAIAEQIVPAMQKNFSRPPTVKLNNGRPLLIMFMDDVYVD